MTDTLNLTLGRLLEETARRFPDNDALAYPDRGLRISYRQLDEWCGRAARGLLGLGVKKGDHVALWATNAPEWVVLMFATARIGAVLVTVDTNYQAAELEYLLKQSDAQTLFMTRGFKGNDFARIFEQIAPEIGTSPPGGLSCEKLPRLKNLVFIGDPPPAGMFSYAAMERRGEGISDARLAEAKQIPQPGDVVNIQYTSAAAGIPKGVMLTHFNIVNNGYRVGKRLRFSDKDRLCIPLPFYHCFGCVLGILACVSHGAAMVPLETYGTEALLKAVEAERCSALHGVPTMFIAALDHADFGRYDLSSLRTGMMSGAPCPMEAMNRIISDMHASEITIGYGQTEASPIITQTTTSDPPELRVSTIGRPLPGVEVKIVDPVTGQDCPPGKDGEICTRSDMVMKGYYNMPEETSRTIDADGWLHTGDLARADEAGYYRITGRLKKMIIRGGQNIYPAEIEQYLCTHPSIAEVRVYGMPDPKLGEIVGADLKLKEGKSCSEEEVRRFCEGKISGYKIPAVIRFVD